MMKLTRLMCQMCFVWSVLVLLMKFDLNTLIAKADIKSAFRLSPINPGDLHSLGFQFESEFFFAKCLPMGFALSCYYF